MKILLIDPPFKSFTGIFNFYFPLGLTYLAGSAKREGFDCRILDMDAAEGKAGTLDFAHEYERYASYIRGINDLRHPTWDLLRQLVRDEKPDFIGITAMTTKFGSAVRTAQVCREVVPNAPIIVGGAHASTMPGLTMQVPEVDYVIRGEGDETLPNLLKALRDKQDVATIRGVSFRRNGVVIHNPDAIFVKDLDSLPLPDRGALMHPESYSSEDMGVMLTSRGCPFQCSYCFHMWERRVRYRSVKSIMEEIRQVRRDYGTPQFAFKDDSFTVKKEHVKELCDAIKAEPYKIGWTCTTRVDLITDEILTMMKEAGCNVISVGVESGSERILAETDKGITHAQIRRAARLLNKHRIFWSGYFMLGLPTETEEDIQKTLDFVGEVKPYYAGLGVYNPFPRTKLFDQAVELGLLEPNPTVEHFLTTNPKDLFFKDPRKRTIAINGERFEKISQDASAFFHRFNMNPWNLLRRGFARRKAYFQDPSLLYRDIGKALEMLGIKLPGTDQK
ncbi:MAG: radical SAM protein [Candidatus Ozemobacteraceae bacterium]